MQLRLGRYLIVYLNDDGEEELLEVHAYSAEQAVFLSSIEHGKIIDVVCTVAKMAGGA